MTRVLLMSINYAPEPTGIAPYTTRLATGLSERGLAVRVLTTFPHYPEWRFAEGYENGWTSRTKVSGIPVTRLRHYVPRRPSGLHRAVSEMSFAARLVGEPWHSPDVVVSQSPALLGVSAALARARGGWRRPALGVIAQDLYSAGVAEAAESGSAVVSALSAIERTTLASVDGVVAIHPRLRSRIVQHLQIPPERVTVIRNWTHVESAKPGERQAVRDAFGWRSDEIIALHTGAMGEKQALGNVVEAARIADRTGRGLRFVLVGDGGQRQRIEAQARGITNIDLLPPVASDQYAGMLAAADVLLVNERAGLTDMAVPSKLTSYFSSGRPVIAAVSASSTTAEEVEASEAGIRVEPEDPEALVASVRRLAADPGLASRMGARGLAFCETVLSEKTSLDAYAEWVEQLASRRRRRGRT